MSRLAIASPNPFRKCSGPRAQTPQNLLMMFRCDAGPESRYAYFHAVRARNRNLRRSSTRSQGATRRSRMRRRTQRDAAPLGVCFNAVIKQIGGRLLYLLIVESDVGSTVKARTSFDAFPLKRFRPAFETSSRQSRRSFARSCNKVPALQPPSSSGTWTPDAQAFALSFDSSRMSAACRQAPSEPASSRS